MQTCRPVSIFNIIGQLRGRSFAPAHIRIIAIPKGLLQVEVVFIFGAARWGNHGDFHFFWHDLSLRLLFRLLHRFFFVHIEVV